MGRTHEQAHGPSIRRSARGARPALHRHHGRARSEEGSTVVEAILVVPVLMTILLVVVQLALWAHAAQVAQLAASEGDRAARSYGGGAATGVAEAESVVRGSHSGLSGSTVAVTVLPGDLESVAISGRALSIVPWLSLPVSSMVIGPIQEFRGSE